MEQPTITRVHHDDSDYVTDVVHHPMLDSPPPSSGEAVGMLIPVPDLTRFRDPSYGLRLRVTLPERIIHLLTVIHENHNERLADDGVGTLNDILVSQIKQIIKELT
jgi:hypothetical protein